MRNNTHDAERQARFDAAAEDILNETNPDVFRNLALELYATYDASTPDRLLELYRRAESLKVKLEFAELTWLFFREKGEREKGFFFLLDILNQQVGDASLRAVLKQHPLPSPFNLTTAECDVIVAMLLNFLEEHLPTNWNKVGEMYSYEYLSESPNNQFVARLLVVLYEYPATSPEAKEQIDSQRDFAVIYTIVDHDHYYFDLRTIDHYLKRRIY